MLRYTANCKGHRLCFAIGRDAHRCLTDGKPSQAYRSFDFYPVSLCKSSLCLLPSKFGTSNFRNFLSPFLTLPPIQVQAFAHSSFRALADSVSQQLQLQQRQVAALVGCGAGNASNDLTAGKASSKVGAKERPASGIVPAFAFENSSSPVALNHQKQSRLKSQRYLSQQQRQPRAPNPQHTPIPQTSLQQAQQYAAPLNQMQLQNYAAPLNQSEGSTQPISRLNDVQLLYAAPLPLKSRLLQPNSSSFAEGKGLGMDHFPCRPDSHEPDEYKLSLGKIVDTLMNDYPLFFEQSPNFDIYDERLVLQIGKPCEEPKVLARSKGAYSRIISTMRGLGTTVVRDAKVSCQAYDGTQYGCALRVYWKCTGQIWLGSMHDIELSAVSFYSLAPPSSKHETDGSALRYLIHNHTIDFTEIKPSSLRSDLLWILIPYCKAEHEPAICG